MTTTLTQLAARQTADAARNGTPMPNSDSLPATAIATPEVSYGAPTPATPIGAASRFRGKKPKAVTTISKTTMPSDAPPLGEPLLLPTEGAAILRISVKTFYHRIEMGLIRHYKIRGRIYLTASDIQDYIERHLVEPVTVNLGGGK